jgi:hypothetical protein
MSKILAIFANHTCNNIKYNISLNNISLLRDKFTNIIIVDTKNEEYANKLHNDFLGDEKIINYFFVENDNYFDFGKWIFALNNIDYKKYDYIMFINDSIILLDPLDNFFLYFKNSSDINLYAYNDSTQIKYHYQSYLFFVKSKSILNFINFFESKKNVIVDLESLVHNVELNMCNIIDDHDCFLKIGNEWNMSKNLYWENESLYKYLLSKNIFSIIKLKKIFDIQREYKIDIYGISVDNFDYEFYKSYYDDLNSLSNIELLNHFIEHGQYEGRKFNSNFKVILPEYYREKLDEIGLLYFFDVPKDFDIYYYKKNNADVESLSILETIFHYINYGVYEGRTYNKKNNKCNYINKNYLSILNKLNLLDDSFIKLPDNFNVNNYIILNPTLNNLGYMSIIKHYIKYGSSENLEYTINTEILSKLKYFNPDIYKKIYSELSHLNNKELENHYINFGITENRICNIPKDFDANTYKKLYNDLSTLNTEELINHYIIHGIKENRIYKIPDDFNEDIYIKLYNDLSGLNREQLIDHYINYGIKENRIYKIPNDFDCTLYKKIYSDLSNIENDDDIINHYLLHGIGEKRIYKIPDDFDCTLYKKIYKDLEKLNDDELKTHYLIHGMHEKRIYKVPDDFDTNIYSKIYDDLSELSNSNLENHYLLFGYHEGRIYKIPSDFDCEIYKKIYKDLNKMNDNELKEHYLRIGIKEGRIYKIPNDFTAEKYKFFNNDLSDLNNDELINHYINYGIKECRKYI